MKKSSKIIQEGITFDDVLLLPKYSTFRRSEVDLTNRLHEKLFLKLPVISSPMDTVTETDMASAMAQNGGLGIIHRNLKIEDQIEMLKNAKSQKISNPDLASVDAEGRLVIGAAVGAGDDLEMRIEKLAENGVDVFVVDSGHGHSEYIIKAAKFVKTKFPKIPLMAGNVATYDGAKALMEVGVDILRVGVGPGSICTTRIISGMGVPQLTAVENAVEAIEGTDVTVVADGGIKQIGDMAKALGFGAHAVMLGSLLAGFDESPGEKFKIGDKEYKAYRGMGSLAAMVKGGAERYGQDPKELKEKLIAEGVEGLVDYKGKVSDYLYQVSGSLKSSFYYIGSKNFEEFHKNAEFVKITPAGMKESDAHSITITEVGGNYVTKK
ncbi:MAG TPA: IMP dehydrogenase [Candidatus Dojkabacteria bacterium]|jgi:IMP dehydrogenase